MVKLLRKAGLAGLLLLLLSSCGVGDDDGQRLGEYIVGTWQRGWGPGDVIIEGAPEPENPDDPGWTPDRFSYDKFIFYDDGTYNGMIRTGSFVVLGKLGETIFTGEYKCDNSNLKMDFTNEDGQRGAILALVRSFSETTEKRSDSVHHSSSTYSVRNSIPRPTPLKALKYPRHPPVKFSIGLVPVLSISRSE